jgi:trehalose-6-phosphatase
VTTQTAQAFATTFLSRCVRANTEHQRPDLNTVPEFDVARLLPRYRHSRKRLFLLDFEGTLWFRPPGGATAGGEGGEDGVGRVVELLRGLIGAGRNEVWLLSGLPVRGVLERVAEGVPGLGIV